MARKNNSRSQGKSGGGRRGMLQKIHVQARQLGQTDDQYRDMLDDLTKKCSAADLSNAQLSRVIDHMNNLLTGPKADRTKRNPGESPQRLKIKALLAAGNRPLAYGDALAKNMCRDANNQPIRRLEWVPADQLGRIIGALKRQARREGWPLPQ